MAAWHPVSAYGPQLGNVASKPGGSSETAARHGSHWDKVTWAALRIISTGLPVHPPEVSKQWLFGKSCRQAQESCLESLKAHCRFTRKHDKGKAYRRKA